MTVPFLFRADRLLLVIAVGAGTPELGSPSVQQWVANMMKQQKGNCFY